MAKSSQYVNHKVHTYIDELFDGVGGSQQLYELKEELATNLKEKISDFQSQSMDEEHAFREAVISMGDLGGLVEDMRQIGQDQARQKVYSLMRARVSNAGIVAGVLLTLFGAVLCTMMYFMEQPAVVVSGPGVFIVVGGALITYSIMIRETDKRYALNKIRAGTYGLSVGIILFGLYVAASSGFATGQMFIAISSFMVIFIVGVGLLLSLILSENDRRKNKQHAGGVETR